MNASSSLVENPFASGIDAARYFPSLAHSETLARLEYLVERRNRVGLLCGPAGSGKSLVLEVAARNWKRAGHAVAIVNLLGLSQHDFLWQTASQWKCPVLAGMPAFALWHAIGDMLIVHRCEHRTSILLLDDAGRATHEVLETIERLVQLGDTSQPRLTIVLASGALLSGQSGQALLERAELRLDLGPWEVAETRDYLQAHLQQQGPDAPKLDMPATERLHALAAGLPRRLNQLTNLVLLAAASEGAEVVDVDTVDKVYRELSVQA